MANLGHCTCMCGPFGPYMGAFAGIWAICRWIWHLHVGYGPLSSINGAPAKARWDLTSCNSMDIPSRTRASAPQPGFLLLGLRNIKIR